MSIAVAMSSSLERHGDERQKREAGREQGEGSSAAAVLRAIVRLGCVDLLCSPLWGEGSLVFGSHGLGRGWVGNGWMGAL